MSEEDVGSMENAYLDSLPIRIIKFGHSKILSWSSLMARLGYFFNF